MKNWFEENPIKSIITHTVLVAGVTWGISYFIIDENKVNYYQSQVESARTTTEQYKAKTEILQTDNAKLISERDRYLKWLEEAPNTIPFFEKRIKKLENENLQLRNKLTQIGKPSTEQPSEKYSNTLTLNKSQTFIDSKTGVMLSVTSIDQNFEAEVSLTLPGEETKKLSKITAGEQWRFVSKGGKFMIIIKEINWYNNTFEVMVIQEDD